MIEDGDDCRWWWLEMWWLEMVMIADGDDCQALGKGQNIFETYISHVIDNLIGWSATKSRKKTIKNEFESRIKHDIKDTKAHDKLRLTLFGGSQLYS